MAKYIIIGGVAGGATAAARLRRRDEHAEIIIFERGEHVSFANCGLPYYVGDVISQRDSLLLQTPESLRARFQLDVRIHSEVISVDPVKKVVRVRSHDRGEYEESYDKLLLSPGAQPIKPPIPGIDDPRIMLLRNVADADRLKAAWQKNSRKAIVVGGGFIGIEMAENLRHAGLAVTLLEAAPHILAPFDEDMVIPLENELRKNGIGLLLEDGVQSFHGSAEAIEVTLASGRKERADFVVLAIGVRPDTRFLQDSGIALGARGHILVDEFLQTSQPDIYAVGDAVETFSFQTGKRMAVPLAGPANRQGRLVADTMYGEPVKYKGVLGTAILKIFSLTAAATGSNERQLGQAGIPFQKVLLHPGSHAGYYPGAVPITLKLLFAPDGKVLGAQAFGLEGVDKRIDVIATVLRMEGNVEDLMDLELSYAPPYSSAKDPVNMAAYLAENILHGLNDEIPVQALDAELAKGAVLVDVRTRMEYQSGHFPAAMHIPVDELRSRLAELDRQIPVIVYCKVGLRGYIALRILQQNGYQVKNISGGYTAFLQQQKLQ